MIGNLENAMEAYEAALRHNPYSIPALNAISCILRTKEQFAKAVEYLQTIINIDTTNGEIWGSLGKIIFWLLLQYEEYVANKYCTVDRPLLFDDG